jgi:hypothetical protein
MPWPEVMDYDMGSIRPYLSGGRDKHRTETKARGTSSDNAHAFLGDSRFLGIGEQAGFRQRGVPRVRGRDEAVD